MRRLYRCLILVFLACTKAPAQTPEWVVYNHGNSGLPDDAVYAVALGESAARIGTANGLAKYSAGTWTVYDTSNSEVPALLIVATKKMLLLE